MSVNIEQEIARRLGVDVDSVSPAMEAVIQRIRQQVAHYGYARMAGIGTFRQQEGVLRFEADPALAESVNHRFTGLEPLAVESTAPTSGYQKHEVFHAEEPAPPAPPDAEQPGEPFSDEPLKLEDEPDEHRELVDQPEALPDEPLKLEDEPDEHREPVDQPEALPDEPHEPVELPAERWELEDQPADRPEERWEPAGRSEERREPADQPAERPEARSEPANVPEEQREPADLSEAQSEPANLPEERWAPVDQLGDQLEETLESEDQPADRRPDEPWEAEAQPAEDREASHEPGDRSEERYWEPSPEAEGAHPLGPLPESPYEEAEFSVVPEGAEGAGDEALEEEETFVGYEEPEFFETEEEDVPSEEAVAGPPVGVGEGEPHPEYEDEPPEPTVRWNPAAEFAGEEDEIEPQPDEPPYVRTTWSQPPEPEAYDETGETWDEPEPEPEEEPETEPEPLPPPPASTIRQRHERPVQRGPSRFVQEQERSRTPWIAGAVIILLAVAAAAIFLMLRGPERMGDGEPGEMTGIYPPVPTDTVGAGAGADTAAVAVNGSLEERDDPVREETGPLYGDAIDEEAGGWTLVAASETSRAAAERVAERFRQENFRTGILAGTSGNVTRYRVGVGQFTSLAQAEQFRDDLAGNALPADAWVHRID